MQRYCHYIAFLLIGCQEPIELAFQSDAEYLVIDGFITDDFGPHEITITKSKAFENDEISVFEPVENASVSLIDDVGVSFSLAHSSSGIYQTDDTFIGEIGRSYTLQVELNGETYQSTPQLMPPHSNLDSVYFEEGIRETFTRDGVVYRHPTMEFLCDVTFEGTQSYAAVTWMSIYYKIDRWNPFGCFTREFGKGFTNLFTNEEVQISTTGGVIEKFLVNDRFDSHFFLSTFLYSMNKEAFEFHSMVNQQRNSTGSVFDPLPFQIAGNIRNTEDPEQVVLGYFGAYSKVETLFTLGSRNFDDLDIVVCRSSP